MISLYNVSSTAAHIQLSQTGTEDANIQCLALWGGFMALLSPSLGLTVVYCSLQARVTERGCLGGSGRAELEVLWRDCEK